jgi:hypothetical protein
VSGGAMLENSFGTARQAHVGAGVSVHVKGFGWKCRYDELAKQFNENLQKS